MDTALESLKLIISNARKSLNRPYSTATIKDKEQEIQILEGEFQKELEKLKEEQRAELLTTFVKFKEEALELLDKHSDKKNNRKAIIMANLDMNELSVIIKLVPIFTGKKDELHNFVTNLEMVYGTISTEKRNSFFSFIFKSRLDLKVQNRIKQDSIPLTIEDLIAALRKCYKQVKSSNSILNELTRIVQKGDNLMGFADKIESLVIELNEIQIADEGESNRASIVNTNNRIAFNSFMNGLKDPQIIATIDASQVTTFAEAVSIAEKVESRVRHGQVLFQTAQPSQYRANNRNENTECGKCGRKHGDRCPAMGMKCHNCGRENHFSNKCFSRRNYNNRDDNRNQNGNRSRNNNRPQNDNRNNGYRGNGNPRGNNRNINQIQDQGNCEIPEITRSDTPEETF